MPRTLRRIVSLLTCALGFAPLFAQQNAPAPVFAGAPAAQWISHPADPGDVYGVWHFRRAMNLPARPEKFIVHVSADNRYRLFVNGQSVATGPERSDPAHWRYRTIDLAPYLTPGRNVLAAVVWNWGPGRPVAQFSRRTGFLIQANSPEETLANTGPNWKVQADSAYAIVPIDPRTIGGYYAAPPGEAVNGSSYPWGWQQVDFDDQAWPAAKPAVPGPGALIQLRGTQPFGEAGGWQLVPGTLPPMEEKPVRFARVRRAEGVPANDAFLRGQGDLV